MAAISLTLTSNTHLPPCLFASILMRRQQWKAALHIFPKPLLTPGRRLRTGIGLLTGAHSMGGCRAGLAIAPRAATYLRASGPVVIYRNAPNRKHPAFIGSLTGFIGCQ